MYFCIWIGDFYSNSETNGGEVHALHMNNKNIYIGLQTLTYPGMISKHALGD